VKPFCCIDAARADAVGSDLAGSRPGGQVLGEPGRADVERPLPGIGVTDEELS